MSVTFSVSAPTQTVRGQCDCCDGSGWDFNVPDDERIATGPFGTIPEEDRCWVCSGSGVVDEPVPVIEGVQLSNDNAAAVLAALGLPRSEYGSLTEAELSAVLRRELLLRNTPGAFDGFVQAPDVREGGHAGFSQVEEGNVVHVQRLGAREVSVGRTSADVEDRVYRVLGLFRAAKEMGVGVYWG